MATQTGIAVALTGYLGVSGTDQFRQDGLLFPNSQVSFASVGDGLSNTLLVGERPPSTELYFGWCYAVAGQDPDLRGSGEVVLGTRERRTLVINGYECCAPGPYGFDPGTTADSCATFHHWITHASGSHFLFAYSSVRFLTYAIGADLLAK